MLSTLLDSSLVLLVCLAAVLVALVYIGVFSLVVLIVALVYIGVFGLLKMASTERLFRD